MTKFIVFLHAKNVIAFIVKMDHLCGLFEKLGFFAVTTYMVNYETNSSR